MQDDGMTVIAEKLIIQYSTVFHPSTSTSPEELTADFAAGLPANFGT